METNLILKEIDNIVKNNDVVLFMKGTADIPLCGFSAKVVAILNKLNINFKSVNILESQEMRQGIKDFSDWPTLPQLYIKGVFIGGCDIVSNMFAQGELQKILQENNLLN